MQTRIAANIAVLLVTSAFVRGAGMPPPQTFPDGVSAKIVSAQIGGEFSYAAEDPVEHPHHADGSPCGWILFDNFHFTPLPDDKALYVWFRMSSRHGQCDAVLTGEDGQFDRKYWFSEPETIARPVSNNASIVGYRFSSYPRRQVSLRITLVRKGNRDEKGVPSPSLQFEIPNPEPSPAGQWIADALPIVRNLEGSAITLVGLETGMPCTDPWGDISLTSRLKWTATTDGKPTNAWGLRMLYITDATGNRQEVFRASEVAKFDKVGSLENLMQWPLWLSEDAWKISAEFVRVDALPDSQMVTLSGLEVGEIQRSLGREQRKAIKICVPQFPESPVRAIFNADDNQPGNILRLSFEFDDIPEGFHCSIVKVTDADGNVCKRVFGFNDFHLGKPGEKQRPSYLIDIPDTSKTISITFGLQKIRTLTFQTKPAFSSEPVPEKRR